MTLKVDDKQYNKNSIELLMKAPIVMVNICRI